jgi:hypothetical protein
MDPPGGLLLKILVTWPAASPGIQGSDYDHEPTELAAEKADRPGCYEAGGIAGWCAGSAWLWRTRAWPGLHGDCTY